MNMSVIVWIIIGLCVLSLLLFLLPYIFVLVVVIIGIGFIARLFGAKREIHEYSEYKFDEKVDDDVIDVEFEEREEDAQ